MFFDVGKLGPHCRQEGARESQNGVGCAAGGEAVSACNGSRTLRRLKSV